MVTEIATDSRISLDEALTMTAQSNEVGYCRNQQEAEAFIVRVKANEARWGRTEPISKMNITRFNDNLVNETIASQPQETDLQRALRTAEGLSDAALALWSRHYESGPVAGACRLELARRVLAARENDPQHAAAMENAPVIDAVEWMRQDAIEAGCPVAPRAIPAGVMELLAGCTPAERERALAVYGG